MRNKCFIITQKGFTLLELMAVMVIMGIMVAVTIRPTGHIRAKTYVSVLHA